MHYIRFVYSHNVLMFICLKIDEKLTLQPHTLIVNQLNIGLADTRLFFIVINSFVRQYFSLVLILLHCFVLIKKKINITFYCMLRH